MSYEYEKIHDVLKKINEDIGVCNIEKQMSRLKESEHFNQLEEVFKDFQNDVQLAAEHCRSVIESPIYVGVIGHYSHGKSSLLNAMLFPPKVKELLPTGESIVTSLCTLLQFHQARGGNEFFEHRINGDYHALDENEYQRKVSGKIHVSDVRNFRISLSVDGLQGDIFGDFAKKRIELLDTPGLGGPYWNDEYALQKWVEEFMLLIVCIKADSINAQTAEVINPFLKFTSRPVIPVVTFWDMWQQSDEFEGISEERAARAKAKEDLKKHFPTVGDSADMALFVSAKNCREDVPLDNDLSHYYTSSWNIDNVRKALSSYVNENRKILVSQKSEESFLDKNRRNKIVSNVRSLKSKFESLRTRLEKEMEAAKPKAEYDEIIDESVGKIRDDVDREYDRIIDRLEEKVSDCIGYIPNNGKFKAGLSNIRADIVNKLKEMVTEGLRDRIKRSVERSVLRDMDYYLDRTSLLSEKRAKHLHKQIQQRCDEFVGDVSNPRSEQVFKEPSGITDLTWNLASALIGGMKQLFLTNLPLALIVLAVLIFAPFLLFFFKFLPGWLNIALIGICVVVVGGMFYDQFKKAIEKTALEVKEKTRKSNRRVDIAARLKPEVEEHIKTFQCDLHKMLQKELEPVMDLSDNMFRDIEDMLRQTASQIKQVETECSIIEREARR